jgi:DNA-binding MarR family transcriptional regulator
VKPSPASRAIPNGCSHLKLRRLMRLVSRHYDRHLAECGLKTTQYTLLMVVATRGPLRQSELARILCLDASTLTRNLRPLMEAGMLEVSPGEDGRSHQVRVTPAGLALRTRARRRWQQAQEAFDRTVGTERVAALHGLVDDCQRLLAADAGPTQTPRRSD